MLRKAVLAVALCATFSLPAQAHNCRCVYAGGEVGQGQTACIRTSKGEELARCEMVLNNSSWKMLGTPCNKLQSQKPVSQPASGSAS